MVDLVMLRLPYCMDSLRGIIASQLGDDVETIIAGGAGFEGPVKKYFGCYFRLWPRYDRSVGSRTWWLLSLLLYHLRRLHKRPQLPETMRNLQSR
ncbi:hypothetical protein OIU85_014580 [Salix viminalis]|uniref:Uncharacterized protein n=1 Tax=Salix viminalis TaxID=40686 RepID=A0A9Q0NJ88_SALVM|nr:hypothetical protein OIU85_014580 [Salix viminalis]